MEALIARISALQPAVKAGILVGIVAAVCGGYYSWFYSDLLEEKGRKEVELAQSSKVLNDYKERKRQYLAYLNERNQLRDEQKELLRVLPEDDDIAQFIETINTQVEVSGLTKVQSVREPSTTELIYERIPVRMSLVGPYHQINRFFKNVSEMQRIVTIADLSLNFAEGRGATANGPLKAEFLAQTFKLVDAKPVKPAAPGAK